MNDLVVTTGDVVSRLGRTKPVLSKLAIAGMLHKAAGGWDGDGVAKLEAQKSIQFDPWNPGDPTMMLAVPTTSEDWSASLYLSDENDRADAVKNLGGRIPEGLDVTGWWPCADKRVTQLVEQGAVILGIVGGFVREAARIVADPEMSRDDQIARAVYRRASDRRCAFLVRPLAGDELAAVKGFVPGHIGITGTYVTPADPQER